MLNRHVSTYHDAVAGIRDGATILLGGFGGAGVPIGLCGAVIDAGLRDLVVIANNAGSNDPDLSAMLQAGRVRKVICSYPKSTTNRVFADLYAAGKVELEVLPQGTLVERFALRRRRAGWIFYARRCRDGTGGGQRDADDRWSRAHLRDAIAW